MISSPTRIACLRLNAPCHLRFVATFEGVALMYAQPELKAICAYISLALLAPVGVRLTRIFVSESRRTLVILAGFALLTWTFSPAIPEAPSKGCTICTVTPLFFRSTILRDELGSA